jgi:hypothetical protein
MAPALAGARKDAKDASKGDSEVDAAVAPLPRSLSCSPWLCTPAAPCARAASWFVFYNNNKPGSLSLLNEY